MLGAALLGAVGGASVRADTTAAAFTDKVLHASITDSDLQSYRELPFDVPAGTQRMTVTYEYTGRGEGTTIDIGLLGPDGFAGPDGFRGWSGGNKKTFTVSARDATPSYLPGPLTPGQWRVLLGIPQIRKGQRSALTATIHLEGVAADPDQSTAAPLLGRPDVPAAPVARHDAVAASSQALTTEGRWYRGDLHMHTAHSDGSCANQSGMRVPCPLFLTAKTAADAGLDFIAITDHNTVSHVQELRALQPYFSRLLLIPGMEVTTFQGHANAFGLDRAVDFRVGSRTVPTWNALLDQLEQRNALVSINHPNAPTGEICMGCGWTAGAGADLRRVTAVEAVNGADADSPVSGIPFWHQQLNQGLRMTGIGGSDNHDALLSVSSLGRSRIGAPTTVIYATALSLQGIQDGIRAGNVFIDVQGTRDRILEMNAASAGAAVVMGGEMSLPAGSKANFKVHALNADGAHFEVIRDGTARAGEGVTGTDYTFSFTEKGDGAPHWLRVNVRDAQGRLLLVGNPIYLNRSRMRR